MNTNARNSMKKRNYDEIHITNLDDDFEELVLADDGLKNVKVSHGKSAITGKNVSTMKPASTEKDPLSSEGFVDPIYTKFTTKNGTLKPDPISSTGYNDPIYGKARTESDTKNITKPANNNTSGSVNADARTNTLHKNGTEKVTHKDVFAKPTPTNPRNTPTSQPPSARDSNSTPLNQRNPVSSIQITKRNVPAPRSKKDQKGYGHEVEDLFIDDIEDF